MKNNVPLPAALAALLLATTGCGSDAATNAVEPPEASATEAGHEAGSRQDDAAGDVQNDGAVGQNNMVDGGVQADSAQQLAVDGGFDATTDADSSTTVGPDASSEGGPVDATVSQEGGLGLDSGADSRVDGATDSSVGAVDGSLDGTIESGLDAESEAGHDAGHDAGLDGSTDGAAEGGHDGGGLDGGFIRFSTGVYAPILGMPVCTACHGRGLDGGPGPGLEFGRLDFSSEVVAYESLVGDAGGVLAAGAACGELGIDAGLKRVLAGDPAASLLYNKVASNAGDGGTLLGPDGGALVFCGNPMPLHRPALSAADMATIRDWIQQGANP